MLRPVELRPRHGAYLFNFILLCPAPSRQARGRSLRCDCTTPPSASPPNPKPKTPKLKTQNFQLKLANMHPPKPTTGGLVRTKMAANGKGCGSVGVLGRMQ
eukprot:1184254-Prorocentrum_minimum.AAC.2